MLRPQPRPSVRQPGCDQTGQTESLIPLKPLSTRASPPSNVQSIDQSTTKGVSTQREGPEPLNLLSKYWAFSGLILTTIISILLLTGNIRRWTVSKGVYEVVAQNRGSTQLVVQVISNALGLLHVTIISVLINYLTRLRLASMPTSFDTLRLWNIMLRQSLDLTLPIHLLAILLIFVRICITPSTLWAGAITPISVSAIQSGEILQPTYSDMTLLRQNWGNRLDLPSIQNTKGSFAYNVGDSSLVRSYTLHRLRPPLTEAFGNTQSLTSRASPTWDDLMELDPQLVYSMTVFSIFH
jgi:hypothetical protein